ncbi:hypothetical protein [Comamonas brasiliensis]|uniref:hypothetical protein n=1 Tax=Comamonas brasiliensis TaxID=1812482 RepID=UPI001B8CE77D|nr:hypothetical protein [Comamonas sp. PE63]
MAQAVTHLCFEALTMTAEALSPPNPAESLRERLIRKGVITPEASDEINQRAAKIVNRVILVGNLGRGFYSEINRICGIINKVFKTINKSLQNACLSLAEKKINKLILSIEGRFSKLNRGFEIVRHSFFFAFKVDKRNTP